MLFLGLVLYRAYKNSCVVLCVARRDQRALCKVASIVPGTAQIELRAGKGYSGLEEDGCAACVPLKVCVSLLWSWNTGPHNGLESSPS